MKTQVWQVGGKWIDLDTTEVGTWVKTTNNTDIFKSVQEYEEIGSDSTTSPLFFDFDSTDIAVSQKDTIKVVEYLQQYTTPEIYFSGNKGFHVIVRQEVVGIDFTVDLHKKMKNFVKFVENSIEPLPTLDYVVYSSKRMLRIPNSKHGKSGLYKIPISLDELKNNTVEEIKELAKEPRTMVFQPPLKSLDLSNLWNSHIMQYDELNAQVYEEQTFCFSPDKFPVCVEDILNNGWKVDGHRNLATIQLATFFKTIKMPVTQAVELLETWVTRFSKSQGSELRGKLASTRTVTNTIYENSQYVFGCNYIRSVGNAQNKVACTGSMCEFLESNVSDTAEEVDLFSTIKAENVNKLVATDVIVASKRNSPYIVPNKVKYTCWGRDKCTKSHCPLYYKPDGSGEKSIGQDREIIAMLGGTDSMSTQILQNMSGVPRDCKKYDIEVLENINIEEALVTPTLENGEYVLRKVYLLNDLNVEENKHYKLIGRTYAHPKTQEGTILVRQIKSLTDKIDDFKVTESVVESIDKFRNDNSLIEIDKKIDSITDFFECNIMKLAERQELILGLLLTYLSVLRINTPWEQDTRGWINLIILGDTGTGKSTGVEKLQQALNLGQATKAETTGRTGLVYKLEQNAGSWFIMWGLMPRNDRELLWLDECSEIPKETYGEMTETRSSGRVQVNRAVSAETKARVRLILTGNAKFGKQMADYTQAVESLSEMFLKEDIRRFDFGLFLKSNDVNTEMYNEIIEDIESPYDIQDFKNLVLFAWSRKSSQVILSQDTIKALQSFSGLMSQEYGNATAIPLVSPSDQKYKLLRMATALAILTGSIDNENVVVLPTHVEYIYNYLRQIYNHSAGLQFFAGKSLDNDRLSVEQCEELKRQIIESSHVTFSDNKDGTPSSAYLELLQYFNTCKIISEKSIDQSTSITGDEAKGIMTVLIRGQCIKQTQFGFQKTGRLNQFIAWGYETGVMQSIKNYL